MTHLRYFGYRFPILNVLEIISENLDEEGNAALAWFNTQENASFEITGIVDPPAAPCRGEDLRLVICADSDCRQEAFKVSGPADVPTVRWLGIDHV